MMNRVYKSKVDIWLVVAVLLLTLFPLLPMLRYDFSLSVFCANVFVLGLIMTLLYGIRYIADGKYLVVRYGFLFSRKFLIEDLVSIKSTNSIISAPAASLDRIELTFRANSIIISPKDKYAFIKDITESCSHKIDVSV